MSQFVQFFNGSQIIKRAKGFINVSIINLVFTFSASKFTITYDGFVHINLFINRSQQIQEWTDFHLTQLMHLEDREDCYFMTPTKKCKPNQDNSSGKRGQNSSDKSNPFTKFIYGEDSKTPFITINDQKNSQKSHKNTQSVNIVQTSTQFIPDKSAEIIYLNLIQNLKKGIEPQFKKLYFRNQEQNTSTGLTKLIAMNFNSKNSKNVVYSPIKGTIVPIFKCEQCLKDYEKASALGGHLSKCAQKKSNKKREQLASRNIQNNEQLQYNSLQSQKKIEQFIQQKEYISQ